jgi:hypothetical protein
LKFTTLGTHNPKMTPREANALEANALEANANALEANALEANALEANDLDANANDLDANANDLDANDLFNNNNNSTYYTNENSEVITSTSWSRRHALRSNAVRRVPLLVIDEVVPTGFDNRNNLNNIQEIQTFTNLVHQLILPERSLIPNTDNTDNINYNNTTN